MNNYNLPILLLDNFFLFPKCVNYLILNNIHWRKVISYAWKESNGHLLIVPNKEQDSIGSEKYALIGTLAKINLDISSDTDFKPIISSLKEISLQGLERVKLIDLEKKDSEIWRGNYQVLLEKEIDEKEMDELTEKFVRYLPNILEKAKLNSVEKLPYMTMMRGNIGNIIDFITQNSREIDHSTKWRILSSLDLRERLALLINLPDRQKIEKGINEETNEEIRKQQEEYYLREKLKIIERKLRNRRGHGGSNEMKKYLEKLEKELYPNYVKKVVYEEMERYELMPSNSSEANVIRQYIDWIINFPWLKKTKEINDLDFAQRKLDEKHYGLEKVKRKILTHLSTQQRVGEPLGKVICLVGLPGVGKTSLASSIAEATGRKFVRISVGGINDVSKIKGHRRTYIGSMPGEIVQALRKKEVQVINPVLLIDEVDKIGHDNFRGNPSHALLEVLDPNQNKNFIDDYLGVEVPINLSEVMFICTANQLETIPEPLRDRMEIIHLSSYTEVEKFNIAKNYLIPNNLKKGGVRAEEIKFEDQAIWEIIRHYTREAGVRELSQKIWTIIGEFNLQLSEKKITNLVVTPKILSQQQYLGKPIYDFTQRGNKEKTGVVNGLAYTGYGGDILPIEVVNYPRKEGDLELTGNLGDIMKESGRVALNYIKANYKKFDINLEIFSQNSIHVHAPEGAIPKEGPSAGIALTSAIISSLINRSVPQDIGMTGEITLHGHVGAIGGLKEKAIAAHRSGLKTIIIPKANEKDIEDIPEEVRKALKIIMVEEYEEVWKIIFVKKPKKVSLPVSKKANKEARKAV